MNWPHQGALRIHHDPTRLPIQRPADQPGRDRFDDPIGEFVMRYLSSDLRGCLVETMDRFRPDPKAEALLASISGSEDVPGKTPALVDGVDEWLTQQRVARVQLNRPRHSSSTSMTPRCWCGSTAIHGCAPCWTLDLGPRSARPDSTRDSFGSRVATAGPSPRRWPGRP